MRKERHLAREIASSTLYSLEFNSSLPPSSPFDLFQGRSPEETEQYTEETRAYVSFLVNGAIEHLQEIDSQISRYSHNRPLEEIDAVDRSILRISFVQLLYDKETHPAVVIDEAVKLSQELSNSVSFRFINGVLDAYRKEHEPK